MAEKGVKNEESKENREKGNKNKWKKEISKITKPSERDLDTLSYKTLLLSLEIVIANHQLVWKLEKDGWLNQYYKILMGRCKNLTVNKYLNMINNTIFKIKTA